MLSTQNGMPFDLYFLFLFQYGQSTLTEGRKNPYQVLYNWQGVCFDRTGEENGNPLQYSCLGNPVDRGAWWATVQGVAQELNTTE